MALLVALLGPIQAKTAYAADEFDTLRLKWKELLAGGTSYSGTDPDIAAQVAEITAKAQANWDSMSKTPGTYLWSDLASPTASAQITSAYTRLKEMALAYATYTSTLYNSTALKDDIILGLDWMHQNRYNQSQAQYGNWWDWQIGAPLRLLEAVVLVYPELTAAQITNYMNAVEKFTPSVGSSTGANRLWMATVVGVRGVIVKNSAKVAAARNALSQVFDYVTSGDGYYQDGSFIQHNYYSYNGGYGSALLGDTANLIYLLSGSTWAVTDPDVSNVYKWVYDSYEPFIYQGALMDMTRGREISREAGQDHEKGARLIQFIVRLSSFAPAADAAAYKSMIKYWIQADTYRSFYVNSPLPIIVLAKSIVNDPAVTPRGELIANKPFNSMARAVHLRPGFGFAVSMSSSRIANYESINGENKKGWYTGEGMTYLYNGDLGHYSGDYWPTVNSYRLPGTTVDTMTRADSSGQGYRSSATLVGGAELEGLYGTAAMSLDGWSNNLWARKAWFMFDDEVVALGAGITDSGQTGNGWDGTPRKVETVIENRKLNASGGNTLLVNGSNKTATPSWSQSGVTWAHLAGSAPGSDIGYYFPGGAEVKGLRESRTGRWSSINVNGSTADTTNNFQQLWFDHGTNPTGEAYAYALLPGKSGAQTGSYAADPDIAVLENSTAAQAVYEKRLGVTGAVFWADGLKWIQKDGANLISSSQKSSVMLRETAGSLEVAVSDPTQLNTGTVSIEINRSAASLAAADPGVTVTQLSPTVKLEVNASGAKGRIFKAAFNLNGPAEVIVDNTSAQLTGVWTASSALPNYYGSDYLYNNSGTGADKVRWTPALAEAGRYTVYYRLPDGNAARATNAPFTVFHNGGSTQVRVNQQTVPGGSWLSLGSYEFQAGTSGYVELTDQANGNYVIADAVRFVKQE
jgi:hyaluronate lyase